MKKLIALVLTLVCVVCLIGCSISNIDNSKPQTETTNTTYKVEIANNYPIENTLKSTYEAGEQVTVKLSTITEHYYRVYVNGVEQNLDRDASDMNYTYYTFTMPSKDVLVEITDVSVDIPNPPAVSNEYTISPSLLTCFTAKKQSWANPDLEMSQEQAEFIIGVWNDSEWENDITKTAYDFVFRGENIEIRYCYDEGIFNDVINNKHVVLPNEIREQVNKTVDKFIVLPIVD